MEKFGPRLVRTLRRESPIQSKYAYRTNESGLVPNLVQTGPFNTEILFWFLFLIFMVEGFEQVGLRVAISFNYQLSKCIVTTLSKKWKWTAELANFVRTTIVT